MKKFTRQHQANIAAATAEVTSAEDELTQAIQHYNEHMEGWKNLVEDAQTAYNEKLQELKGIYDGIAEEARNYYEERSEKWQESDVGIAYSDWWNQLESVDLEDVDIEFPDELELPDFVDVSEDLAPSEPEA